MDSNLTPPSSREAIRTFLSAECHLLERDERIFSPPPADGGTGEPEAGFVLSDGRPLKLRFDLHLDLDVDGVVVDSTLGTLGLIYVFDRPGAVKDEVNRAIESAAYLRHLLGEKRAEGASGRAPSQTMPYAIEVVFVDPQQDAADRVGAALREIVTNSELPHAIGIGYVSCTDDAELRHAFSWLLPATRTWFRSLQNAAARTPQKKWAILELQDFRRPGVRRWKKYDRARLHVLHGHNGCGKSSLAEAFEFLLTGSSSRLEKAPPNGPAQKPRARRNLAPLVWVSRTPGKTSPAYAAVRLLRADSRRPLLENETRRPRRHSEMPADGFRLDERLSDRLISTTPEERADTWFQAFFSDYDQRRAERTRITAQLRRAVAGLRKADEARREETEAAAAEGAPLERDDRTASAIRRVLEAAQPFAAPQSPSAKEPAAAAVEDVSLADMIGHLPGNFRLSARTTLARLKLLGLKLPVVLRQRHKTDRKTGGFSDPAGLRLDLTVALHDDRALLTRWQAAMTAELDDLLARLAQDVFGASGSGRGGHATFNQWLRYVALGDLHEKALVLARTRAHLPPSGDDPLALVTPAGSVEALAQQCDELRRETGRLRDDLASSAARQRQGVTSGAAQVRVGDLGPLERAIDAEVFGTLLQSTDKARLRDAVRRRQPATVRGLRVGSAGWVARLQAAVEKRREALKQLAALPVSNISPAQRADWIVDAVDCALRYLVLQAEGEERFIEEVERNQLAEAIDELVTLFTPASWAYPPIKSKIEAANAARNTPTAFRVDGIGGFDARKVLNTAERNTLALAVHLLCAPRVDNPYRVVFLDDPLQNMDELTVTAVARGLARLLRLWRQKEMLPEWHLVLLLHGQEDCDRIVRECPAARYDFPWLLPENTKNQSEASPPARTAAQRSRSARRPALPSPASSGLGEDIVQRPGSEEGELQTLLDLLTLLPPSAGTKAKGAT